jgi:hypothetical protein
MFASFPRSLWLAISMARGYDLPRYPCADDLESSLHRGHLEPAGGRVPGSGGGKKKMVRLKAEGAVRLSPGLLELCEQVISDFVKPFLDRSQECILCLGWMIKLDGLNYGSV